MESEAESRLLDYAKTNNAYVFRIYVVELIQGPSEPGDFCALMLSNRFCGLFPADPPPGPITPLLTSSWFDLTSLVVPQSGQIRFEFRDASFHFHSSNEVDILDFVNRFVYRFLTPAELAVVSLPRSRRRHKKANSASFLFRLTTLFEQAHVHHHRKLLSQIERSLKIGSDKLQNLSFGKHCKKALDILFTTLSLQHRFKQLEFDETGPVLFSALIDHWEGLKGIEHLTFSEQPTPSFIEKVNSKTNTEFRAVTFCNCPFDGDSIHLIIDLIHGGVVSLLGFRNGLSPDSAHMITTIRNFHNIRFFEIDRIADLDLEQLCPCLRHLEVLAVTNCNISICFVLKLLHQMKN
jgi:hypothetical protein